MTVISINPDRALTAVHELNAIDASLVGRSHLPAPPPLALLPHLTLAIAGEVEHSRAAIRQLARRTAELRASLAATNARIMIASGDIDDPRLEQFLLEAVRPGAALGGGGGWLGALGGGLWNVADAIRYAATGATSALFLGLYAHGRMTMWLAGEMPYADFRSVPRSLSKFGEQFAKAKKAAWKSIPGGARFGRALGGLGTGLTLIDSYGTASAQPPLAKGITATVVAAATVHPAGAALDFGTGGVVTGSINAIVAFPALFTGDTVTLNAFTTNATNGTYGPVFQVTSGLGDGIAAAATGDLDGWTKQVGDGKFGTPLKLLHDGENAIIDKLYSIGNPFN